MKKCTKCKEAKPFVEFNKDAQKKDGYRSWCKQCVILSRPKNIKPPKRERIYKSQKGYILKYVPEHPHARFHGKVPEHRLVMEKEIGRYIDVSVETVHHKDGDVTNNKLSNLELLTHKEHRRVHAGWKKIKDEWWKTCQTCKMFLKVTGNFYRRKTQHNEFVSECKECIKQKANGGR